MELDQNGSLAVSGGVGRTHDKKYVFGHRHVSIFVFPFAREINVSVINALINLWRSGLRGCKLIARAYLKARKEFGYSKILIYLMDDEASQRNGLIAEKVKPLKPFLNQTHFVLHKLKHTRIYTHTHAWTHRNKKKISFPQIHIK